MNPFNLVTYLGIGIILGGLIIQSACLSKADSQSTSSIWSLFADLFWIEKLPAFTNQEIIGSLLLMIMSGLANAGGLGGGALLTPIFLLIFKYPANKAIMTVYGAVFGGAIGNFVNVVSQRNPQTHKPNIDYNLSLICMPLMILGAMVGVLLNRQLPPILPIIGIIAVVAYSLKSIYKKAKKTYEFEAKLRSQGVNKPSNETQRESRISATTNNKYSKQLQSILKEEYLLFPLRKLGLIGFLLIYVLSMIVLRGSKEFHSIIGIPYCSLSYWIFFVTGLIGILMLYLFNTRLIESHLRIKKAEDFKLKNEEFILTQTNVKKLGVLSLISGVLAGLLGIGGGMIMSPKLLELGMEPRTLAATSGFFVLQTSFISLFQTFFYGDIATSEVLFFASISFIGSFGISKILNYLVWRLKRQSIILYALCVILLMSLIVMPSFALYKSIENPVQMLSSRSIC